MSDTSHPGFPVLLELTIELAIVCTVLGFSCAVCFSRARFGSGTFDVTGYSDEDLLNLLAWDYRYVIYGHMVLHCLYAFRG